MIKIKVKHNRNSPPVDKSNVEFNTQSKVSGHGLTSPDNVIGPAGDPFRASSALPRHAMEGVAPEDTELGYEKPRFSIFKEDHCGCGCDMCMNGDHHGGSGGDPDSDGDGVYSPEELYVHFDLNQDGVVEPQEYEDHVEWHADNPEILDQDDEYEEYIELDESLLYEKKDRCYYLAKQKYDVFPSAYASGFIVRCRKGKVGRKKKANETIELDEKKRKKWSIKYKRSIDCDNPKGFSQRAHCQGRKKDEEIQLEEIELEEGTFDKEKSQGLRGWFARQGGKGKSKGWVDCNTCRTNPKTGRKTCKTCGRQSGEQRSKYPACRPTPSACNRRGTSKKRGPTRVSWKKKKKEE